MQMFFEYLICVGKACTHYTPNYEKKKTALKLGVWQVG